MTNSTQTINIFPRIIYPADENMVLPLQAELRRSLTGMGHGITELVDPPDVRDHFNTRYLVATHNGHAIGSATIRFGDKICELYKLYVSPRVRRHHVGTTLFAHVIDQMRAVGMTEMKVEAQPDSAEFWRKMSKRYQIDQDVSCFSNIIFVL
jgi:GNAT superfamily N-acetyltransferase